jgi:hypothetical protein
MGALQNFHIAMQYEEMHGPSAKVQPLRGAPEII